ncbi:hypothetical protein CCMA1212_006467 [Trichoderma ghanense]|uniref:Uncharacterized protein n=1 Tax=Trichoderma ghanense TaxID=65468 RepID=A0ABY2H126_9HYPO
MPSSVSLIGAVILRPSGPKTVEWPPPGLHIRAPPADPKALTPSSEMIAVQCRTKAPASMAYVRESVLHP